MKRLILFVLVASLFACTEMTETKTALISGQVFNPTSEFISFFEEKNADTATLDSTGKFTIALSIKEPGFMILKHGPETSQMYLYPGDDIYLTLDTEEFDESINYSGTGALQNNYLASKFLISEKMNKDPKKAFKMEEEMFLKFMKKNQHVLLQHLDTFFVNKDEKYLEFAAMEKNRMIYEMATERLMYPSYYKYLTRNSEYEPSENYYGFLDELDLDSAEMMVLDEYRSLIQMYVSGKSRILVNEDPELKEKYEDPYSMTSMMIITQEFKDEKVRNFLLKESILELVNYRGLTRDDTIMTIFYTYCNDTAVIKKVEEGIKKWEKIAKGQPAPGFEYPDIDGEIVSLADLKGKYVYVDVWATWCGPCKAEIPHLKALEEEMHGRNVAFVSVSVDDSKEDWEKMVKDKDLGGIQLFGGAGWKSTITEDYNIRGIPRFILIDMDGMIIDATAPRPSGDIKDILLAQEGI